MTRPGGIFKREPQIIQALHKRYHAMSKADWVEVYRDLYRRCYDMDSPEEDWMEDAERRREILRVYVMSEGTTK